MSRTEEDVVGDIGFKVIRRRQEKDAGGEQLESAMMGQLWFRPQRTYLDDCRVDYRLDDWVEPRPGCGPLCLFSHYVDAERFIWQMEDGPFRNTWEQQGELLVYVCRYQESQESRAWNAKFHSDLGELCQGTVLADRIRLLSVPGPGRPPRKPRNRQWFQEKYYGKPEKPGKSEIPSRNTPQMPEKTRVLQKNPPKIRVFNPKTLVLRITD